MIYVRSINNTLEEPLINISDDFSMQQSALEGTLQVSFTTYLGDNNPGYELLVNESKIFIEEYEFTVKTISSNQYSKSITAVSSFFDNAKKIVRGVFSGSHTLSNQLSFALSNSGWFYQIDDDISDMTSYIENLGEDNVISLLEKIVNSHNVEYVILPNRKLRFSRQVGNDTDFQFRYKYNLSDVTSNIDTVGMYTFIRGVGADGITAEYTSPNASVFGILEAPTILDERFTSKDSLKVNLISNLKDTPDISIDSSIPILTSRPIGERVWLIYPPLGLEISTRIIYQEKILVDGKLSTSSVTLGNSQKKSTIDLGVSQQQQIDETSEELEETKDKFRSEIKVTNDRITLEVEELDRSIASIDIKADNINLSVNNRITNEVAMIDIRADSIQSSVTSLDARTSSSITQLSNSINLKVDVGGSITDINLSQGIATINADKINLNGAVMVNGTISGATSIQITTDVILGRSLRFSDFTALTTGGGSLTLEAYNSIHYVGTTHYFNGVVDFSNATVVGL